MCILRRSVNRRNDTLGVTPDEFVKMARELRSAGATVVVAEGFQAQFGPPEPASPFSADDLYDAEADHSEQVKVIRERVFRDLFGSSG